MLKVLRLSGSTAAQDSAGCEKPKKGFRKSADGTAAIEFAIVAPVFLMMVFGIFEVGLHYMADRMLNSGLDNAARLIKTGQIKASQSYGMAEFRDEVCNQPIMFLFTCDDRLLLDVQTVGAFGENDYETDENGDVDSSNFGFAPGGRTTINVVRAFYNWPTVLDWANFGRETGYTVDAFGDGDRLIVASAAFMNEPFN